MVVSAWISCTTVTLPTKMLHAVIHYLDETDKKSYHVKPGKNLTPQLGKLDPVLLSLAQSHRAKSTFYGTGELT